MNNRKHLKSGGFGYLLIVVNTEQHTGSFRPFFCPCEGHFIALSLQPNSNKR